MSARAWFRRVRRVGALTGVVLVCTVGAAAQTTPERTDIGGFSRYHTYVRLEPFEYFDPQVANVILRFTDLELPGDGGRVLRFTRTYNNMVEPSNWMHTLGWSFGIEGFVTSVWGTGFLAPGTPINNTTPEPFRTGGVQLVTSDGGIKQTFYMQTPVPGEPIDDNASQRWVKSVDHLKYD